MNNRKAKLEKALAFEANEMVESEASILYEQGRKNENRRLAQLHAALIEAVKALELYASVTDGAIGHQTAKLALAKIDKAIKEHEDGK